MDYILNSYCMLSITSIVFLKTYKVQTKRGLLGPEISKENKLHFVNRNTNTYFISIKCGT